MAVVQRQFPIAVEDVIDDRRHHVVEHRPEGGVREFEGVAGGGGQVPAVHHQLGGGDPPPLLVGQLQPGQIGAALPGRRVGPGGPQPLEVVLDATRS